MFAFIYTAILLLSEAAQGEGGFLKFYNDYLNIPGFEIWKFLNLGIFIAILTYLLKKPLSEAFKAKREAIRAELIKAEEEKQAALVQLGSAEAKLVTLDSDTGLVLTNAQEEAAEEKRRLAEQTEADIKKLREQSSGEINRLTLQVKAELRKFSAEESIRLAEEKLRAGIDDAKDSRLVKAHIDAIGGLN